MIHSRMQLLSSLLASHILDRRHHLFEQIDPAQWVEEDSRLDSVGLRLMVEDAYPHERDDVASAETDESHQ